MADKWKEIWNKRGASSTVDIGLHDLIAPDGFDSGAGKIIIQDWREYVHQVSQKLNLKDGDSVYEVGCEGGAFLYALLKQIKLTVGGCDYSAGLIEATNSVFKIGDFACNKAKKIIQNLSMTMFYQTVFFIILNLIMHVKFF